MKEKAIIALAATTLVVGCASDGLDHWASNPVRIGPDTYRVVAVNGYPQVLNVAYRKATATCTAAGREMLLLDSGSNKASGYDLTFRCLASGDPELRRGMPSRPADVQVEVIRR